MSGMTSLWRPQRWALCELLEFDAAQLDEDADFSKVNAGSNEKTVEKCTK